MLEVVVHQSGTVGISLSSDNDAPMVYLSPSEALNFADMVTSAARLGASRVESLKLGLVQKQS